MPTGADVNAEQLKAPAFQLPAAELLALADAIQERAETVGMTRLAKTGSGEWSQEGEDRSYTAQLVQRETEIAQDTMQGARWNFAPMPRDGRAPFGAGMPYRSCRAPELMRITLWRRRARRSSS